MTSGKKSVGRPLQKDSDGNPISKTLVNLTIPVKLKAFLDKHVKNRSAFFTRVVTMLYVGEICPKCYGDNLSDAPVGIKCADCNIWIKLKDCEICNAKYDPRKTVSHGLALDEPNPHYNPRANIIDCNVETGCSKCMGVKE